MNDALHCIYYHTKVAVDLLGSITARLSYFTGSSSLASACDPSFFSSDRCFLLRIFWSHLHLRTREEASQQPSHTQKDHQHSK